MENFCVWTDKFFCFPIVTHINDGASLQNDGLCPRFGVIARVQLATEQHMVRRRFGGARTEHQNNRTT
ncbi:hypothetical protein [Maribacter sp. 2307ULW6-5]|uniref:hypothetical protein n=1 Tax=Maribacter sp. 2307ULW6-5 TaxID=3386275 RepID=UPI0039BC9029